MYSMLCWYRHLLCYTATVCLLNQTLMCAPLGPAELRRRRARRWWWAGAASCCGGSWSGSGWPSPGPPLTPWALTEAWLAPTWRSRCWNAARKEGKVDMNPCLSHLSFYRSHLTSDFYLVLSAKHLSSFQWDQPLQIAMDLLMKHSSYCSSYENKTSSCRPFSTQDYNANWFQASHASYSKY